MLKRNLSSMAMSLAEAIIGVLLLINPIAFTSGIIIAFGVVLMITGIHKTIRYFRTEPEEAAVSQTFVKGLLALLAGAFCAFHSHWFLGNPFSTTAVLWMFIGITLILDAVFDMISGIFGNRKKAEPMQEEA